MWTLNMHVDDGNTNREVTLWNDQTVYLSPCPAAPEGRLYPLSHLPIENQKELERLRGKLIDLTDSLARVLNTPPLHEEEVPEECQAWNLAPVWWGQ